MLQPVKVQATVGSSDQKVLLLVEQVFSLLQGVRPLNRDVAKLHWRVLKLQRRLRWHLIEEEDDGKWLFLLPLLLALLDLGAFVTRFYVLGRSSALGSGKGWRAGPLYTLLPSRRLS